jgi:hypothetical protein
VLALGATVVGCSYEHGPLSDTPDTTSLGTAGRWGAPHISTATGVRWRPSDPNAVLPTVQGESSMLTTQVQPPRTLRDTRGLDPRQTRQPDGVGAGVWISGPNLPVEPWNMALEPAPARPREGHGGAKAHRTVDGESLKPGDARGAALSAARPGSVHHL